MTVVQVGRKQHKLCIYNYPSAQVCNMKCKRMVYINAYMYYINDDVLAFAVCSMCVCAC